MSYRTALLPPDPSDVPNELARRIQVLEDSMRMPGMGGYAAVVNSDAVPQALSSGTYGAPETGDAGPTATATPPKSGRVAVTVSMQSIISLVGGTEGAIEAGVRLSGGNTRAIDFYSKFTHRIQQGPRLDNLPISRTFLLEGLASVPTTFTVEYRRFLLTADPSAVFVVHSRVLTVVPL